MEDFLAKVKLASEGLYMVSETDAPFEPIDLGVQPKEEFNQQHLLNLLSKPEDATVEVQEVDYFLRNMTKAREGAREEKLEEVKRFQHLQQLLIEQLNDVKVYRVGKIQVDTFILGWTSEGHVVGLKTFQVET